MRCARVVRRMVRQVVRRRLQPPPRAFPPTPRCVLKPHPVPAGGAFWLAADAGGLWLTRDGGVTLARVPGVARAYALAVGAPLAPGGEPVAFVFGACVGAPPGADLGVLASADAGAHWVDVPASNGKGLGNWPAAMAASRQHAGVVYVGSFGRGALSANASALLRV